MKWKTKKNPKPRDERERIIFALTPRVCEDGHTRWLEQVKISERYEYMYGYFGDGYYRWEEYAAEGL